MDRCGGRSGPKCRSGQGLVVPVLLSLLFLSAGCTSFEFQDAVHIPDPPSELEATYAVSLENEHLLNVTVEGLGDRAASLGDGSTQQGTALELRYDRPGWRTWRLELVHAPGLEELREARLRCQGEDTEDVRQACPRNNPERYELALYDAAGAPGMLGLGPFLGSELTEGDTGRIDVWDPADPGTLSWAATPTSDPDEPSCLRLDLNWTDPTAKTPVPTLPYERSLRACEGVPLPVKITSGPIHWELKDWNSSGDVPQRSHQPANLPPPRDEAGECSTTYPAHDDTTLPAPPYMAWAKENDNIISDWTQAHPRGFAFPSVADALTTGEGTTSNSYVVKGVLLLYDPAENSLLALNMGEEHRRTLFIENSSFQQSEHLGSGEPTTGLPPMDRMCPASGIAMGDLTDTVRARLPSSANVRSTFLAPELMWGLQGLGPWTWPYQTEDWEPVRNAFAPPAWPYRGYVTYLPDDRGVGLLDAAAIDPAGEWIRWLEREPAS